MAPELDNELNEQVEEVIDDATVITVPIDATLQNSNEAADAKAVGDALALKADKSELQAAVKVNNQPADAQGLILIDGRHIPVSDQDTETLANAVTDLKGKTAADIPMSSDSDAKTIAEVVNANSEAIEGMEEMTGATMPIESGSQTTVKAAIEARVKTVNRKAPDADGDVDLSVVPLAENLQSDKMESVEGSFIIRTTGGNASVSDGKAYLLHLFGSADHAGYVAEQLNMTVIPITRTEPDEPITATIDRDTFVAYVDESSTINLYYTTEWSADPELYGITVTGTPEAGDQIMVVYVKEVRGTITVANPARLVGTGWNLFDYNNGYARVVKYSTEYGYKIGGSYASLQFSATLTGERSSITPGVDGLFNVPSDGYVFVTGGNNTDTYILTTWSDWMEGPSSGYWEPYRESGIDLSAVMTTYFPNGLLAVGTTRDEIDLSAKRSISRIERMAYSEENRAAAAASGRSYDFDQDYIYIVRESAVISAITIDTTYNVSEHGLEWFTETTLPVISEILYGKNLRDKLERDVVTISAQTLTEEEKAQVRTNIGAMSQADGDKKLVAPTTAGTNGQLLQTNGDGTTEWTTQGTPTDAQVGTAVSAWLTAHPEATTTVQDGAISRSKLNDDLKAKTDAVPDLKSAFDVTSGAVYNASKMVGERNECVANTVSDSTFIRSQDGSERSGYTDYNSVLVFIPIPTGFDVWSKSCIVYFYSSNTVASYISGSYVTTDGKHTPPTGAMYMRLCWMKTSVPYVALRDSNGNAGLYFDGDNVTFANESIPSGAVSGVTNLLTESIPLKNIQKVLHERNECTSNYVTNSAFIRPQDGTVRTGSDYADRSSILNYIEITSGDTISQKNCIVYYYDSSENYLGNTQADAINETPLEGTKYIRICWEINYTPVVIIRSATNESAVVFDGTKGEFVPASIPNDAVSGLDDIFGLTRKNDISIDKWVDSRYIRTQDGEIRSNDDYKAIQNFIDITGITEIMCVNVTEGLFFYTETPTFIPSADFRNNIWITPPQTAKYIRASTGISTTPHIFAKTNDGIMIVFDPNDNVSFAEKCIPFNAVDAEGVPATLPPSVKIVAPSGGDYTNISSANAHCDGSYAMWILPGVYEDYFQAGDDTYGNKRTKKSYIGISKNDCVIERHGAAYAEDVFATNGRTYMKNLTMKALKSTGASTCGYALHLDNGWLNNGSAVFEDCYFFSEGRAAAGIGTRPGCNIIFRNCIFECGADSTNGALYLHNSNDPTYRGPNQNISFENCIIHSAHGSAIKLQYVGDDNNTINLTMIDCTVYSDDLDGEPIVGIDDTSLYTGTRGYNILVTDRSHGNNIDIKAIIEGT